MEGSQRPVWGHQSCVSSYQMGKCKKQDPVSLLAGHLGSEQELCSLEEGHVVNKSGNL